jgi:hypothetical protein
MEELQARGRPHNPEAIVVQQQKTVMKRRAEDERMTMPQIYREEVNALGPAEHEVMLIQFYTGLEDALFPYCQLFETKWLSHRHTTLR